MNWKKQNPFYLFEKFYKKTKAKQKFLADVMILATATKRGTPSARVMLFKGIQQNKVIFFTNYESRKSKEIKENPLGSLVFFWSLINCQIRIEGKIRHLSPKRSDNYWKIRPRESQMGGLASKQSSVLENRQELLNRIANIETQYKGKTIPRPPFWGGYCLIPHVFEFWFGQPGRLHERYCYKRQNQRWKMEELSP